MTLGISPISDYKPGGTDVAIADGGTGQGTAQAAIDALTAVGGATNEHVLTKDTGTGNATFKAAASGTDIYGIAQGRLTLTTAVPVTVSDVTGATTLYYTPYNGDQIGTYSGSAWTVATFTEQSLDISGYTADRNYDIFIVDSTLALEGLIWTDATNRATALTTQNGVYVKTGQTTRRYLGTIRITDQAGECEDSVLFRGVWNNHNRVSRAFEIFDATDSWTYGSATVRPWNNSTANRVEFIVGLDEDAVTLHFIGLGKHSNQSLFSIEIGFDVTDAGAKAFPGHSANSGSTLAASWIGFAGIGFHFLQLLESGGPANTTTYYGDFNLPLRTISGALGEILG